MTAFVKPCPKCAGSKLLGDHPCDYCVEDGKPCGSVSLSKHNEYLFEQAKHADTDPAPPTIPDPSDAQ
jgi:hypothetical protein